MYRPKDWQIDIKMDRYKKSKFGRQRRMIDELKDGKIDRQEGYKDIKMIDRH